MRHFPIFVDTRGQDILLCGGGEAALAKLRLILKTEARVTVFAPEAAPEIDAWADAARLTRIPRLVEPNDVAAARLIYAATEDPVEDARIGTLARAAGVLVNTVDTLEACDFITPAMVDRTPVTVAIGTEGAAPVLARRIKAQVEENLTPDLGLLARAGQAFRKDAMRLPFGQPRRAFWSEYYDTTGPKALAGGGPDALPGALASLLQRHLAARPSEGHVDFVGAGPGDPELLTLKARKALDLADVVLYDRLVPASILELARREAVSIETGKSGFGPSMPQADITACLLEHAAAGHHVVRLKSGDPSIFGRLDEERAACDQAGIASTVIPGITAASAAAAALGRALTRRGRNSRLSFLTAHDIKGFADHDWRSLARPDHVAAFYMAKRAAVFLQGRLLMHGAAPDTPLAVLWNVSQPQEHRLSTTLATLAADMEAVPTEGPAVLLYGLTADAAAAGAHWATAPLFQPQEIAQ